ncbi:MAG: SARP family transcriptional regulator [Clostridiales bacterium]|jgi:DNA-binding SARP family transcriptional activator|nr:SARP family transcriptional regulator [Clostridiales bacterium]
MSDRKAMQVSMLGGCSLAYGGSTLDGKSVRSRQIWTLLEYLITYRFRCVAQEELIDLLYMEEKIKTPLSALKTLIHRARAELSSLGIMDGKEMIQKCTGGYRWNPDIPLEIDTERFEELVKKASLYEFDGENQLRLRLEAIDLYKGDFLPDAAGDIWAMSITAYYRFLYMDLVHSVLAALIERDMYEDVISVAGKALSIDPYDESLYVNLILALINTNQAQAARTRYEKMMKLFYSELGVTPSKELQALYKKLLESDNGVETDLDVIKSQMKEMDGAKGAFFCEYAFFKDVYRLEARSAAREGGCVHICLISISGKDGRPPAQKVRNEAMRKLSECIRKSLRRGDVYSRYSISQFVILLPLTSYENGKAVLERIKHRFRRDYPRLPVSVTYSLQEVEAI